MMLTTKGRYAVMAIVDIAMQESTNQPVSLSDISKRQGITEPYLEQIFSKLRQAGVVKSVRGPGGGYLLVATKHELCVAEVIDAIEESIKMTRCTTHENSGCMKHNANCVTHYLWAGLSDYIYRYLAEITIADVCEGNLEIDIPLSAISAGGK